MKRLTPMLALAGILIAGCGGGHTKTVTRVQHTPTAATAAPSLSQQTCPPGQSQMGCALVPPTTPPTAALGRPSGPLFPDVSNWQGNVDWPAVKAWQEAHHWNTGGVFKMGEYLIDAFARRNASELHRLRMFAAGYWFVRNTGCGHESGQIVSEARSTGIKVVVLDIEVPEAAGYGDCLARPLRAAGFIVVIYSGTGTWPGGPNDGLPLWIASYGPSFGCLWTCHPIAWQFTDGHFGVPVFVPGIGEDDVSVDFGLTKLGAPTPKPTHVKCFGQVRQVSVCKQEWGNAATASRRAALTQSQQIASATKRLRLFRARQGYFLHRIATS